MSHTTLWLGSEASYDEATVALAKVSAHQAAHPREEEEQDSIYLSVVDIVGIITVQGSLLDGTFGRVGQWYGITGYGDIQNALVQATANPEIKTILMVYKSGGGAVAGVNETGQLIRNVDQVKPVFTYTPSTMCSAALWLGANGRKVYASDTALVGSIGVLSMVVSRHRQLKEDGIDAVVIRSGKFKALGHPVDPMSEEAVTEAQSQIDYLGKVFLQHMADRRSMTATAAETRFGQGRVFVGEQALAAGLIDGVVTYAQAFQNAKSSVPADNKPRVFASSGTLGADLAHNLPEPKGQTPMSKNTHIPSADELLAMANGVDLTEGEQKPAATTPAAEGEQKPAAETEVPAVDAVKLAADLATASAALATANTELADLKTKLAEAASAKTAADTVTASLAGIVKTAVKSMSLPLNKATTELDAATPEQLVEAHAEVSALFKAKIKVGGVAAPTKETVAENAATDSINPLFAAAAHLNNQRKGI